MSELTDEKNVIGIVRDIADLAVMAAEPIEFKPEGSPVERIVVVQQGYEVQKITSTEHIEPRPYRNKGKVEVVTVESFLLFIEREMIQSTTVLFASQEKGTFEAVFNYSENGSVAGWGDRKVVLSLSATTSWSRWICKNCIQMDQMTFADFIEANMDDISDPDGATIIEMIKQLKVHRKAEFTSVVDPATGFTNLTFNEQISGETLKGNI